MPRIRKTCKSCNTTALPAKKIAGSMWLELLLWFFIVPGVMYSTYRLKTRYEACAACGSRDLKEDETW